MSCMNVISNTLAQLNEEHSEGWWGGGKVSTIIRGPGGPAVVPSYRVQPIRSQHKPCPPKHITGCLGDTPEVSKCWRKRLHAP